MTNEFNNEENVGTGAEVNPVIETEEIRSGNYQKSPKGKIVLAVVLIALIGLVYAFTCTNLKYITTPNKMAFINYLDKDIKTVTDFYKNNEFEKFIINKNPKVLDVNVKGGTQEISVTSVINKDSLTFTINNSNDKVYLIDFNNLAKLYENLGIEDVPEFDANTFTTRELEIVKDFSLDCYDIFKNSLTNDDFIVTKDNKISINGNEVEADSVELKLTEIKMMEIAKLLIEEFRDSKIIDIIFEKVDDIEVTKEEFLKSIDEALASFDEDIEELRKFYNDEGFEVSHIIYRMYDKNGIIARELIIGSGDEIDSTMTLITNNEYYEFKTIEDGWYGEEIVAISDKLTEEKDATYHNIKLISQYIDFQYVPSNNDDSENPFDFFDGGSYEYIPVLEEKSCKIKAENNNTKFTLIGVEGVEVVVDIDNKIKVDVSAGGVDVNIAFVDDKKMTTEKLIEDGAMIINNMTNDELIKEANDIMALLNIPGYNNIQRDSQVNSDIVTAEQIGKAITIWNLEGINGTLPTTATKYYELKNIEEYIGHYQPVSLAGSEFFVLDDDGTIKVAIAKEVYEVDRLTTDDIYDGTGAGWAYVQGQY